MEALGGRAVSPDIMLDRLQFVEESSVDSLYVCEEDGEIIGLLGFRIRENLEASGSFGEISAIVVNPESRYHGIGRFMMDFAEKLAEGFGCQGLWLVSGFGAEAESHEFYKKLGFEVTGYRFVKMFE